jgi:hypothetical protein
MATVLACDHKAYAVSLAILRFGHVCHVISCNVTDLEGQFKVTKVHGGNENVTHVV